jgi:hypothetical protein
MSSSTSKTRVANQAQRKTRTLDTLRDALARAEYPVHAVLGALQADVSDADLGRVLRLATLDRSTVD